METGKHHSLQIMLIDSDPLVRDSLKLCFESSRSRLLIFKSAREGLNALKYQDIDVVVSDYLLPDMDGIAFLKQVGADHPHIIRILTATLGSDELDRDVRREKIDRFIKKPVTLASLDTIISELETKYSH